jgi:hypothetical protein
LTYLEKIRKDRNGCVIDSKEKRHKITFIDEIEGLPLASPFKEKETKFFPAQNGNSDKVINLKEIYVESVHQKRCCALF